MSQVQIPKGRGNDSEKRGATAEDLSDMVPNTEEVMGKIKRAKDAALAEKLRNEVRRTTSSRYCGC